MASNSGFRPQEIQRRKFQEAAALTLNKQAEAIGQTREFMADLSVRMDAADQNIAAEQVSRKLDVAELRGRLTGFQGRTFIDRLRWLFLGQ